MSLPLFIHTAKKNGVLFLIFLGVLTMYMSVMIMMYDPAQIDAIMSMTKLFPEEMMQAMGFSSVITDLTSYLASWLYGMLMVAFPLIYSVILGNRLVAKKVDSGSFAYLLATPNSRTRILVTLGLYALISMMFLSVLLYFIGLGLSGILFPGELDTVQFLRLNVTTLLVNSVVIMTTFFFSCLFNQSRYSLGLGTGVPVVMLLMKMLGGVSQEAGILKDLSIYGFYDPVELVRGAAILPVNLGYIGLIAALFTGSVLVFRRRRLPL